MSTPDFCRIDDLVAALQRLRVTHGNTRVCLRDPTSARRLPIGVCILDSGSAAATAMSTVMIHADYNFTPRGYIAPTSGIQAPGPGPELDETRSYDGVVIAVDPGDSRCCHRRCPSLRVDPDVGTCDRYASPVVKAAGGPSNNGAAEDIWFRCAACINNFGG